jgi:molecular chaperone HscB
MDAFDTLGLEPSFRLDLQELSKRQIQLSQALHPDKFVGRSAGERRQALSRAIEVNEAHRALKSPLERAKILLSRLEDSHGEVEAPMSPEFLMEMMELREKLRELGRGRKVDEIESLHATVQQSHSALLEEVSGSFELALNAPSTLDKNLIQGLHERVAKLRYFRRFFDEAEALLDEI